MPKILGAAVLDPELSMLARQVFASAVTQIEVMPEDEAAAKDHLAGMIVELVSAGARKHDELVSKALISLASAKSLSGEWMIRSRGRISGHWLRP